NEALTNEALRERRCEIGGVDGERYRCCREIGGHVLERAFALLATEGELSRRRAEGPGVESREPAAKRIRAGHHLGRATRLGELARPDGVGERAIGGRARELERRHPIIGPV